MKIVRFRDAAGQTHHGCRHADGGITQIAGDLFGDWSDTGKRVQDVTLLSPVMPVDILCIGLNYAQHAKEGNQPLPDHPVLFMKNVGAVQHPGEPIILPEKLPCRTVDYECELAVVLGKECYNVSGDDALDYVLGYTCANDVSERHWQKHGGGGQWCRGKTFATFCPLGPSLVTPEEIPDPQSLRIKTILNGEVMQDSTTADMIFPVRQLIEFLSAGTRLLPGTVILTGTPQGVGFARQPPVFLQDGDSVTIEIDRIGRLTNPVVRERWPSTDRG